MVANLCHYDEATPIPFSSRQTREVPSVTEEPTAMSMAQPLFSHNHHLPGFHPSSSQARRHAGRRVVAAAAALGVARISAVSLAVRHSLLLSQSTPQPGGDASQPREGSSPQEKGSSTPAGGPGFPMPDWAKWFLGSMFFSPVPFYQRILKVKEDVVETVETVSEVVETVAKVTEKVASEAADALPDGALKKIAAAVEEMAEVVIGDEEKPRANVVKVDEAKEAEELVTKEGIFKTVKIETKQFKKKENQKENEVSSKAGNDCAHH